MSEMRNDKFTKAIIILAISNLLVGLAALLIAASLFFNLNVNFSTSLPSKDLKAEEDVRPEEKISIKYAGNLTYGDALKAGKPIAMLVYTDWCGYCKRYAPIQSKISIDPELSKKFSFVWVNADDKQNNSAILKEFNVKGFPSLYLVDPQRNKKFQIPNKLMFIKSAEEDIKKIYRSF